MGPFCRGPQESGPVPEPSPRGRKVCALPQAWRPVAMQSPPSSGRLCGLRVARGRRRAVLDLHCPQNPGRPLLIKANEVWVSGIRPAARHHVAVGGALEPPRYFLPGERDGVKSWHIAGMVSNSLKTLRGSELAPVQLVLATGLRRFAVPGDWLLPGRGPWTVECKVVH